MKKIAIYVALFIVVFVIGFILFFPLDRVVKYNLDKAIAQMSLPVAYKDVNAGIFSTTIYGVSITEPISEELGDLRLKYSPLSALTRKAVATISTGFGSANVLHKGSEITLHTSLNSGRIARLMGQTVSGTIEIDLNYNYAEKKGTIAIRNATPATVAVSAHKINLDIESIQAEGIINNNLLDVTNLTVSGNAVPFPEGSSLVLAGAGKAELKGSITLNMKGLQRSYANLNGNISTGPIALGFSVTGPLEKLSVAIR